LDFLLSSEVQAVTMPRGALNKCSIAIIGKHPEHPLEDIRRWVVRAEGKLSNKINEDTTHLVVDEKNWKEQSRTVRAALNLRAQGCDIKIITFEWLEDSLRTATRKKEGQYLWERGTKPKPTAGKKAAKNTSNRKSGEPRTHAGLIVEVFQEYTDPFIDRREVEEVERRIAEEKRIREQIEKEERKVDDEKAKQAMLFSKAARKARNEIFSGKLAGTASIETKQLLTPVLRESSHLLGYDGFQVRCFAHQSGRQKQP
jgi:hypothetical protein